MVGQRLPRGLKLGESDNCVEVIILDLLGSGGQGEVYSVNYGGKLKALKWYHTAYVESMSPARREAFYENIRNNIRKGAPSKSFLWLQDSIRNSKYGYFGYIMDIRPREYESLTKFLLLKAKFKNNLAIINAALNLIYGFKMMHTDGYSYQDLNDGGFFINPSSGAVLICDNDNVAGQDINFGIAGKMRYMAPEVVLGSTPDKLSDRYSMAVILFRMLMLEHPLEGRYSTPPCMTKEFQRRYYGEDPVFIFDEKDTRNAASITMQPNAFRIWPLLPDYIRELFKITFSKDTVPAKRPIEDKWLSAFMRWRAENVSCIHCKTENLIKIGETVPCIKCGKPIACSSCLKIRSNKIPIYKGVKISEWHINSQNSIMKEVGRVVMSKQTQALGIQNTSDRIWNVVTPAGKLVQVGPKESLPAKKGISIKVDGVDIVIE